MRHTLSLAPGAAIVASALSAAAQAPNTSPPKEQTPGGATKDHAADGSERDGWFPRRTRNRRDSATKLIDRGIEFGQVLF